MKRYMTGFYVVLFTLSANALELDIHVVDETGQPVTNAVLELATEADRMGRLVDSPRMRSSHPSSCRSLWRKILMPSVSVAIDMV